MLYWLYTDGSKALGTLLLPLFCLAMLLPIVLTLVLGRGIQRSASGGQTAAAGWRQALVMTTFVVMILAVTTLYISITRGFALAPKVGGKPTNNPIILLLAGGPPSIDKLRLFMFGFMGVFLNVLACALLRETVRNGGWLRERMDRLRRPGVRRGAMGSAHFCTSREYRHFRRHDKEGVTFYGAFWGKERRRLDFGFGKFCLSGEDAARGVLTIGGPGSGKTAGVILPVIADRMYLGHSLIVADPQGEISAQILKYAKVTGHLVVIHNPTNGQGCARYNLAEGIDNVADARAIANVLIPAQSGDNRFWSDSATALLAASLIEFDNLGDIYSALRDLHMLADVFQKHPGDAALLANSYIASVHSDGKIASNIVATLATALTGWADAVTRANTSLSDFGADLIVSRPVVVMLTCPGRMRDVYASYLGATLRKLMLDLDTIGEQNRDPQRPGALPMPVGIILDEFPTLGKLESLVADVNLVRKRRISILIGAQSKGQFHRLYGPDGTQALFTGLATQIIYGGCDFETAKYYSDASGTTTADADAAPTKTNFRQRPLLTADEVITPLDGNCTIFARYVEPAYATQVVLNAQLTRLYERDDWSERIAATEEREPLILAQTRRAIQSTADLPTPSMTIRPTPTPSKSVLRRLARAPLPPTPEKDDTSANSQSAQSGDTLAAKVDEVMAKAASRKFSRDKYKTASRARRMRP